MISESRYRHHQISLCTRQKVSPGVCYQVLRAQELLRRFEIPETERFSAIQIPPGLAMVMRETWQVGRFRRDSICKECHLQTISPQSPGLSGILEDV